MRLVNLSPTLLVCLASASAGCGDTTDTGVGEVADLSVMHRDLSAGGDGAVRDLSTPRGDAMEDLAVPPMPDLTVAPDLASPCGECPNGYSCGTANGIPVCRAPSGIPRFGHIFVVVMENTSWKTLDDSNNTPYLHGLKSKWAYATDYHGVAHPSLPNYIAMAFGGDQGIGCDCDPTGGACNAFNCNLLLHSCGCAQKARHIGDDLDAAMIPWRAYAESMGAACNTTSAGDFATRHVPFLYSSTLLADGQRCADRVVDYTQLAKDLPNPRVFNFIAPNLVHDMHDPYPAGAQNLANGDAWLAMEIPLLLASPSFTKDGLLVIVWDEDDLSGLLAKDDPIPLFLLSPLAKQGGFPGNTKADHYSLLATLEDGLALPRLGMAAGAKPLTDYFPAK